MPSKQEAQLRELENLELLRAHVSDAQTIADLDRELAAKTLEYKIARERRLRTLEESQAGADRAITALCWGTLGIAAAAMIVSAIIEANTTTVVVRQGFDGGEVDLGIDA